MTKQIAVAASLLLLAIVAGNTVGSRRASAQYDLQSELGQIALAAVEAQNSVLINGDIQSPRKPRLPRATAGLFADVLETQKPDIVARRAAGVEHQAPYSKFNTEFTVQRIETEGDQARLIGSEHTVLTLGTDDPLAPKTTEYFQDHILTFVNNRGQWRLIQDQPVSPPGPGIREENPISVQVQSTEPVRLTVSDSEGAPKEPRKAASSLDRTAIVNYAYAYWQNYNRSYRNFNNTGTRGGDCTNFVSQALRAGGWADVYGFYRYTPYWWYNYFNQTWTWINAHYWFVFTNSRPRGTIARYVSDLVRGDILQIDFDRDGSIDHSMIVTKKDSSNNIYLTYHSNDTRDKPFWDIYASNRNATYYGWRLQGYPN